MKHSDQRQCNKCKFLYITHDKHRPWGCANFGFKSPNLPSTVVFSTTGMKCAYYSEKNTLIKVKKTRKSNGRLA